MTFIRFIPMLIFLSVEIYALVNLWPLSPNGFTTAGLVALALCAVEVHARFIFKVYAESKAKPKGIFDDYLKALLERRG